MKRKPLDLRDNDIKIPLMKFLTVKMLDKFAKRVNTELNADRKAGRLKTFKGKIQRSNNINSPTEFFG